MALSYKVHKDYPWVLSFEILSNGGSSVSGGSNRQYLGGTAPWWVRGSRGNVSSGVQGQSSW